MLYRKSPVISATPVIPKTSFIFAKGFLLIEAIISTFILTVSLMSMSFLFNNLAVLYVGARSRFLAGNLAAYEMERVRGVNFSQIFSFNTADSPADDWSRKISQAPLADGAGEVLVEEINPELKKITVKVFYKSAGKIRSAALETLVAE